MGAPPVPVLPLRGRPAADGQDVFGAFVADAAARGHASSGHHNHNYAVPLTERTARLLGRAPGTTVTVRVPRAETLPVVIRTWRDEARILTAVRAVLPNVPQCLVTGDGYAVHSYVEGVPLSSLCGNGKPVAPRLMKTLAELLARLTQVRRSALPPLPPGWPGNYTDSRAFLQALAHTADRQIRQANWPAFGGLFKALGIPEDALLRLGERIPSMARRPYSLLHGDLHRDNLIMSYEGDPPVICIDWELATYGDPLHDLATHLVRMHYPAAQWPRVIDLWADAMRELRPAAVNGLGKDLEHYIAFERAQSVYPDVMRAAKSLEESFDQRSLDRATERVCRALAAAEAPLGLRNVPDQDETARILSRWRASRGDGTGRGWALGARHIPWSMDRRVPQRPDFPPSAVHRALVAEGAAPAGRVFKGTAHLNSVVRVAGVGFPVVVRRKAAHVLRRERSFLSEHAVLRAIESAGVEVAAPRVLALGRSNGTDAFAIHTYEGPDDIDQPPVHPVHGLLPREADRLVDQLCALTRVDYHQVDPAAGEGRFSTWLSGQLVELVAELPKESQQLARFLGLPDADRLAQMLGRHRVSHRRPALLHGDLNPWNLVRRDDRLALTLIDWELAVVGDPLYDLVRHMHLTPTRPEIRDRMLRRWERALPAAYTVDWRRDWQVYRRIEIVRSAYIDLDRLVTGAGLDAPNVRRAVDSYGMTMAAAIAALGLPLGRAANRHLVRALA
ncbi:aminoglycoside phosphotransferase family protein [Streptomyces sp. enrichment culture]|uniref:aminoglycoside phosphotransferase family protein n=1 Tax=Streptomyces sp. enrichment culture TaxID=1795815 RepID=UPI003F553349